MSKDSRTESSDAPSHRGTPPQTGDERPSYDAPKMTLVFARGVGGAQEPEPPREAAAPPEPRRQEMTLRFTELPLGKRANLSAGEAGARRTMIFGSGAEPVPQEKTREEDSRPRMQSFVYGVKRDEPSDRPSSASGAVEVARRGPGDTAELQTFPKNTMQLPEPWLQPKLFRVTEDPVKRRRSRWASRVGKLLVMAAVAAATSYSLLHFQVMERLLGPR